VFSPYYRRAHARGGADPDDYCALNVGLYGAGGKRWTMTERRRAAIQRSASEFVIGPSRLAWDGRALTIDIDEIGMPLPRRVRGRVRVYPDALSNFSAALDDAGRHRWGPLAACARVEAEFDRPGLRWSGHAYLDSNEGDEPIDRAFTEWDWSRSAMADGSTAVIYDVRQRAGRDRILALRFARDGAVVPFLPPARQPLPRTGWRIARTMRSDPDVAPHVTHTLEDTPFYTRSVITSGLLGEQVVSMHETLNVPRLTSTAVQWMLPVRMPRAFAPRGGRG
jgi:carotenoid 1,2-hydratase